MIYLYVVPVYLYIWNSWTKLKQMIRKLMGLRSSPLGLPGCDNAVSTFSNLWSLLSNSANIRTLLRHLPFTESQSREMDQSSTRVSGVLSFFCFILCFPVLNTAESILLWQFHATEWNSHDQSNQPCRWHPCAPSLSPGPTLPGISHAPVKAFSWPGAAYLACIEGVARLDQKAEGRQSLCLHSNVA